MRRVCAGTRKASRKARSRVLTAIYFFIGSLIANGIGPTIPALLTDYVFKDPAMLRYAIAIVAGIAAPHSLVVLSFGMSAHRDSVQRAEERLG